MRQICCEMTKVLLGLVRSKGGEDAVASVLELAGTPHDAAYLSNGDNWISLDEACEMLEAGVKQTGDPQFARKVGELTVPQNAGTQVATMMRSLGSVEAVMQAVAGKHAPSSARSPTWRRSRLSPGRALVSAHAREGFTRRRLHCDWATGLLAGTADPVRPASGQRPRERMPGARRRSMSVRAHLGRRAGRRGGRPPAARHRARGPAEGDVRAPAQRLRDRQRPRVHRRPRHRAAAHRRARRDRGARAELHPRRAHRRRRRASGLQPRHGDARGTGVRRAGGSARTRRTATRRWSPRSRPAAATTAG